MLPLPFCMAGIMASDISQLSAAELLRLYGRRELSPVDVVRDALARIERFEPRINAFVHVDADGALEQARASEARWRKGEPLGLADGLPATIKDNIDVEGLPSRKGSLTTSDTPAQADAPARRAPARAGRRHSRQDHAAGIGLDRRLPFAAHRHHAQSVERRTHDGRLVRRRGGGGAAQSRRRCISAPTAPARSAFPRPSPACSASSRATAACRPIRLRRSRVLAHQGPLTRTVADAALMLSVIGGPDARDMTAWNTPARIIASASTTACAACASPGARGSVTSKTLDAEVEAPRARRPRVFAELGAMSRRSIPAFPIPTEIITHDLVRAVAATLVDAVPASDARADGRPACCRSPSGGRAVSLADYLAASRRAALSSRAHAALP